MGAFLASLSTVAIAEIGDRTQLLVLMLAVRFHRPWPVLGGMLCASLASSVLAAAIGERVGHVLSGRMMDALIGVSLVAMALWELKPEKVRETSEAASGHGVFRTTFVAFFLAELGDKTQFATAVLAAAYANVAAVVAGATAGMVLVCAPAVFVGRALAERLPLRMIRVTASLLFLALGALFLVRAIRSP